MSHKDFELFRTNFLARISGISSSSRALKQRPWVLWPPSMLKTLPEKQTVESNTKVNCYLDTGQEATSLDFL